MQDLHYIALFNVVHKTCSQRTVERLTVETGMRREARCASNCKIERFSCEARKHLTQSRACRRASPGSSSDQSSTSWPRTWTPFRTPAEDYTEVLIFKGIKFDSPDVARYWFANNGRLLSRFMEDNDMAVHREDGMHILGLW